MRLSSDPSDPGYLRFQKLDDKSFKVHVDGVLVNYCRTVDTSLGYVKAYVVDADGVLQVGSDQCFIYRELHGKVSISLT